MSDVLMCHLVSAADKAKMRTGIIRCGAIYRSSAYRFRQLGRDGCREAERLLLYALRCLYQGN